MIMFNLTCGTVIALCHTDGKIVAANRAFNAIVDEKGAAEVSSSTIAELAGLFNCDELRKQFEDFVIAGTETKLFSLQGGGDDCRVSLQKLDSGASTLILLEIKSAERDEEQGYLHEVGRMTSRLIHDFKNQMGGLKLYAAYLKKRFADQPEGAEIAEKIIQGLNAMADRAALVSKFARPLDLHREKGDLRALVHQAIGDHKLRAEARNIKMESECSQASIPSVFDVRQLRGAVSSIIARALDVSPDGSSVQVTIELLSGSAQLDFIDQGGGLDEGQRGVLFDFLPNERINTLSLDMALARRIIEKHGGRIDALTGKSSGTIVRVKLPL